MRYDVYEPRAGSLLLDVQSDFVPIRGSRVVVPLIAAGGLPIVADLTPVLVVNGERVVMVTHQIFTVLARQTGPTVANLADYRDEVTRALDVLFTGF